MEFSFSYDKSKVIQALRYHFSRQREIRLLAIVVIVFDIIAAVLYVMKKIQPQPFLLGSFIWVMLVISYLFILPYSIYRKTPLFRQKMSVRFNNNGLLLETPQGNANWEWQRFTSYFESPNFFHFYFGPKSFFLIPKDNTTEDMRHEIRQLLRQHLAEKS